MEIQNELSISISSYDDESKYDAACKKLLANKQILARILKACVKECWYLLWKPNDIITARYSI